MANDRPQDSLQARGARIGALIVPYARARLRRSLEAVPHAPRARWRRVAVHRRPVHRRGHCRAHVRMVTRHGLVGAWRIAVEATAAVITSGTQQDVAVVSAPRRPSGA